MEVMFLAVWSTLSELPNGVRFDGKIEIWSIVDIWLLSAQSSSKHGTKMLVPATIDEERCKKIMIEDAILAIKACMPSAEGHTIFMQQGGAKLHTKGGMR
ncbi:unnamed protein product [Choristocarpus tenellus]